MRFLFATWSVRNVRCRVLLKVYLNSYDQDELKKLEFFKIRNFVFSFFSKV